VTVLAKVSLPALYGPVGWSGDLMVGEDAAAIAPFSLPYVGVISGDEAFAKQGGGGDRGRVGRDGRGVERGEGSPRVEADTTHSPGKSTEAVQQTATDESTEAAQQTATDESTEAAQQTATDESTEAAQQTATDESTAAAQHTVLGDGRPQEGSVGSKGIDQGKALRVMVSVDGHGYVPTAVHLDAQALKQMEAVAQVPGAPGLEVLCEVRAWF